jgi:hypothetical protein
MNTQSPLTPEHPVGENAASQSEETKMTTEIFADKQFPNDWHVETIDEKTGDIYQAVFAGPNAERRAREYANWQEADLLSRAA